MKYIILVLLCFTALSANSAVRWNPRLQIWEGNICMNNTGWQIVPWQPLGALCIIQLPGYPRMQGVIINA